MRAGEDIPPALMKDGELFDGRHRIAAADQAGLKRVPVVELGHLWKSGRRKKNPGFELRQWRQPILWDAEALEVELGGIPPAAVLLASLEGPLMLPVQARLPSARSRSHDRRSVVRAGIVIDGTEHDPGIVEALLAHHQPELSVSPTGHKWYSWHSAASELLTVLVEAGTRAGAQHEAQEVELWVDTHLPNPPQFRATFRAWTAPLERRPKRGR